MINNLETLETKTEITKVLNSFIQYKHKIKNVKIDVWISQKSLYLLSKLYWNEQ